VMKELLFVMTFSMIPMIERFRSQIKPVIPDEARDSIACQLLSAPRTALKHTEIAAGLAARPFL